MLQASYDYGKIPGAIISDGRRAAGGCEFSKLGYSFNEAETRDACSRDENGDRDGSHLTYEQRLVCRGRALGLMEAGANIYYLAKWSGIFGLTVRRETLTSSVRELHRNYHIPISNAAAATMILENGNADRRDGERRP